MEAKRKGCDVKLPRKIRAISGYNLHHAECMQSEESKSCGSLAEKNKYSSEKWHSLSVEDKEKYNSMALMDRDRDHDKFINVKNEIAKLKSRLQELAEYADHLPGLEMFFVTVHGGNHAIGGTTSGLKFMQNIASYIPGTFVGYLSSLSVGSQDCYATRPVKSPAEYNETLAEEVEGDSKDELRRGVESLFNTLYGQYVGKRNSKLPYSKIDDYGISIDGLPPGISLKHPSSYGKNAMKLILSNKHLLKLNVGNCPPNVLSQQRVIVSGTPVTRCAPVTSGVPVTSGALVTSDVPVTSGALVTSDVPVTSDVAITSDASVTSGVLVTTTSNKQSQGKRQKPCPGQEVNLVASDSQVVGRGMVMEDDQLHGHEIPRSFVKVAITEIVKNVTPLLRTTLDDPYLTVGGFTAWPASQCI